MKRIIGFWLIWLLLIGNALAVELVRQKNVATYVYFPITNTTGDVQTGCVTDTEIDAFSDSAAPDGFADTTNEATEVGTTGWYYLSLAQAEMNYDYIALRIQILSGCTAVSQRVLIRTMVGDPLNLATTDDGGAINVTGGAIDTVTTTTTTTTCTTASTCTNVTNDVGITQAGADKVWGTTARTITGGTIGTYTGNTPQTGDAYSLLNTAVAEPAQGACSTANISPVNKIGCLDKFRRNKIRQSSSLTEVYNFAGTVLDEKSTVSDDDTYFLRGVFVTGP